MSGVESVAESLMPKLDALHEMCLRSIVAVYGPWYLLHLPSGLWTIAWVHTMESRERLEWHMQNSHEVDGQYTFADRAEALQEIIASLDADNYGNGSPGPARNKASRALAELRSGATPDSANQFTGTTDETRLLRSWIIEGQQY